MTDYPAELRVAPLTTWPGQLTRERQRSPFSSTLSTTITTLNRELAALRATTPVLEVAIEPGQFRIDGRPRATARASHPGVVLSLPTTSVGPLRYATDRYQTWQDNLRAIALGMEALRRVDRYGITRRGEQYAGFRAIESTPSDDLRRSFHLKFLANAAGWPVVPMTPDDIELAYRQAAKRLHPDAGGSTEQFQRLQASISILRGER